MGLFSSLFLLLNSIKKQLFPPLSHCHLSFLLQFTVTFFLLYAKMVVQNTDEKMLVLKWLISLNTANLICILQMFYWTDLCLMRVIGSPRANGRKQILHCRFFWIGNTGVREQTSKAIAGGHRVFISILN